MEHPHSPLGRHVPAPFGLYDPTHEHDACGTGFVACLHGRRAHAVLARGLEALESLDHRGAAGADGETGDGAGVMAHLPLALLLPAIAARGAGHVDPGDLAVGMCFLPAAAPARPRAEAIAEQACRESGLTVIGWRDVPTNPEALGARARETMPVVRQLLLARGAALLPERFGRALYLARRVMERRAQDAGLPDFFVCSLSHRTVVYKALARAGQLRGFYPDLRDPAFETAFCLFHARYSTNTHPTWALAQPFRLLAHNGEVNTVAGNRHWLAAREAELGEGGWHASERLWLTPALLPGGSDSAALDQALDLLVASGRSPLHAMRMLVPEAHAAGASPEVDGFYRYHAGQMEPWDGPSALAFADGEIVAACLDRNGLRPARWIRTTDGLVVLGSEVGLVDVPASAIAESGRLGPGQILAVDLRHRRLLRHDDVMRALAARAPYAEWAEAGERVAPRLDPSLDLLGDTSDLARLQRAFGWSAEDLEKLVGPMATDGKEPIGSMGDDTPLAVFSQKPRPIFHYLKQRFAQVTNPPMDPYREKVVMSLETRLGARGPLLDEGPDHARLIRLASPLLDDGELAWLRGLDDPAFRAVTLDATWDTAADERGLGPALDRLTAEAEAAVRAEATLVILSDRAVGPHRAPVPALLAVAAVHQHLGRLGLRMRASILVESGEPREDHHVACLLGYGADAVNPYLGFRSALALAGEGKLGDLAPAAAARNWRQAIEAGLHKIMAKMGVGCVASYRGAQLFEAVGLAPDLVARWLPGTPSRVAGVGLDALARDVLTWHAVAYPAAPESALVSGLPDWGLFRYRVGGEFHAYGPPVFKAVQAMGKAPDAAARAAATQALAKLVEERPHAALRDLLALVPAGPAIPVEDVEPASAIVKRFVGSAMSHGALSAEAHEVVAIAFNRLGARSNSGEGGEDAARRTVRPNGDDAGSRIKQVAAGRFGVTPAYLASAAELEIKMAQGAKPGEGGQIPGFKVSEEIARLRHATPGVPLISPPPHHDIYSIEDLAQLIHDLRAVNPRARIAVKLVSGAGVGTIAAGVAKAGADLIHVSGHDGGTGASPVGSIKHAGAPWELGLSEARQVLRLNGLRARVRVRVDGGLKSGRDVVVGALLGADEFAFGTALLVAAGCVMARQCHQNTCPVGIASQDPKLRAKFKGTADNVVGYLLGVAEDARVVLASLGLRSIEEAVGRVDLLAPSAEARSARGGALDLRPLLVDPPGDDGRHHDGSWRPSDPSALEARVMQAVGEAVARGGQARASFPIRNVDRTMGARLAGELAARWGDAGFPGAIALAFEGAAGQSFGAFCVDGLDLRLAGMANDYVAKGMAGGLVVVRPAPDAPVAEGLALVGNTVLYGATGGALFVAGSAGQRFAVRNSGARAVVEGTGEHGCEYMTGGVVVVLGPVGRNFAAGMTGGEAYVLDEDGSFPARVNGETVAIARLGDQEGDEGARAVQALLMEHLLRTGSPRAARRLADWAAGRRRFWRVAGAVAPIAAPTRVRAGS